VVRLQVLVRLGQDQLAEHMTVLHSWLTLAVQHCVMCSAKHMYGPPCIENMCMWFIACRTRPRATVTSFPRCDEYVSRTIASSPSCNCDCHIYLIN
jgi:hypothetical protein